MLKFEVIPDHFKKGVIVPIPKGTKNRSDHDNYRGITLTSCFSKIFEKLLLKRTEEPIRDKICNLQGAAQSNCKKSI